QPQHTHITMAKGNAIKEVVTAAVFALGAGSMSTSELKSFDEYYKEFNIKTVSKATAADE
ncbi:hypothetical protein DYB35_009448, partial [Aphanomyces astaci]